MPKQTIIILAGHDNAGKSHIAAALSKKTKIPTFKMTSQGKGHDPLIDMLYAGELTVQLVQQTGYNFIFDRLYPCEYAYSRAFGRMTSHEKLLSLDERYAKMGALIVICYKQPTAYKADVEDGVDAQMCEVLNTWYKEFAKITKCKVLWLDTTDEDETAQVDAIIAASA